MAVPPHHFDDEPAENQPGGLLDELERRQDDVLSQLDDLDAKLSEVLKGLETSKDAAGDSAPDQESGFGHEVGAARKRDLQALLDEASADMSASSTDLETPESPERAEHEGFGSDGSSSDDVTEDEDDFGSADDWA